MKAGRLYQVMAVKLDISNDKTNIINVKKLNREKSY